MTQRLHYGCLQLRPLLFCFRRMKEPVATVLLLFKFNRCFQLSNLFLILLLSIFQSNGSFIWTYFFTQSEKILLYVNLKDIQSPPAVSFRERLLDPHTKCIVFGYSLCTSSNVLYQRYVTYDT